MRFFFVSFITIFPPSVIHRDLHTVWQWFLLPRAICFPVYSVCTDRSYVPKQLQVSGTEKTSSHMLQTSNELEICIHLLWLNVESDEQKSESEKKGEGGHCLSLGFTAVNRHHDQCEFYKGQRLIGAGLQVQRFSPLSSRQAWGWRSWEFYIFIWRLLASSHWLPES